MPNTSMFRKIAKMTDLNMEVWKLNKMISKDSDDIESLKDLAAIYHYLKEDRIAVRIYEKILKVEPENSTIRGFLGYLYYELGNYEKSIEELNLSLDIKPRDAFIYFMLGNSYSRSGLIKEAVKSYDMALLLGFDVHRAHLEFAGKFEDMNRTYKALREYKTAYEIGPKTKNLMLKIKSLEMSISLSSNRAGHKPF